MDQGGGSVTSGHLRWNITYVLTVLGASRLIDTDSEAEEVRPVHEVGPFMVLAENSVVSITKDESTWRLSRHLCRFDVNKRQAYRWDCHYHQHPNGERCDVM